MNQPKSNPSGNSDRQASPPKLSDELRTLADQIGHRAATLREVIERLHGRSFTLVVVLLTLPFLTPIPVPMLSSIFGLGIALIGLRLSLGQRPYLPRRLMDHQLPAKWFYRLLRASSRVVRALEWISRPRLEWVHDRAVFGRFGGLIIMLCGLMLLLPLPVPMSNFFPAAAAFLLAASVIGRDGLLYFVGLAGFVLSTGFFAALAFGGAAALFGAFN